MKNEELVHELRKQGKFGSQYVKEAFYHLVANLKLTVSQFYFTVDEMSENKRMGRVSFAYELSNQEAGSLAIDFLKA